MAFTAALIKNRLARTLVAAVLRANVRRRLSAYQAETSGPEFALRAFATSEHPPRAPATAGTERHVLTEFGQDVCELLRGVDWLARADRNDFTGFCDKQTSRTSSATLWRGQRR
jgi:hypothetical protein